MMLRLVSMEESCCEIKRPSNHLLSVGEQVARKASTRVQAVTLHVQTGRLFVSGSRNTFFDYVCRGQKSCEWTLENLEWSVTLKGVKSRGPILFLLYSVVTDVIAERDKRAEEKVSAIWKSNPAPFTPCYWLGQLA